MTDTANQRGQALVWVRPTSSPLGTAVGMAAQVEQALDQALTSPEIVHDVYRALVRLVRNDERQPRAAIVCVDDLDPEELEFFTILARRRSTPPVYVYGHERSLSKLGRALELGATGEADLDLVARLISPETMVEQARTTEPTPQATDEHEKKPRALGEPKVEQDAVWPIDRHRHEQIQPTAPDPPPSGITGDEEATASPPRVPWRHYSNGPTRKAPSRTPPTREPPIESAPERGNEDVHQPLLTDEELRALIGDDPTPLSPDDVQDRRDRP